VWDGLSDFIRVPTGAEKLMLEKRKESKKSLEQKEKGNRKPPAAEQTIIIKRTVCGSRTNGKELYLGRIGPRKKN